MVKRKLEPLVYKATAGNHDFAIYPESTGRDVALVRGSDEEAEAYARLFAESPAMCDALRNCITDEGSLAMADESRNAAYYARRRLAEINRVVNEVLSRLSQ